MGDHAQPSGVITPNGLLRSETASLNRVLDLERWSKAEERIAELIDCIQPNKPAEDRRNAVASYVQGLIIKCFSCQVFTFGSVPLKTYLPDGDIDLTAFSNNQSLKDTWAVEVRDMLENEEKSENAEFRVKEVQYIQAEVKLVKCLVENIVVDISFNQLGGLCTLCFLEEVDNLVKQDHLFKRSIILIKAWCYYESRILGAHHGLISTYALEILVLYIFHVFNNSFVGPLEVLYRFLEFFSNFDWDNFCVSLWGPVPINSLPDMTAEHPRKDNGELLLNKLFLDSCSSVYSVFSGSQENQGQSFISKHFNVVDPLRTNNNLGRSVSKGNFFRIRSAFTFGAKRLSRLLECPKENIITEVNQFFTNTWERHGSGCRPDAPSASICLLRSLLDPDCVFASDNGNNHQNNNYASSADGTQTLHGVSSQRDSSGIISRNNNVLAASVTQGQRNYGNPTISRVSDQAAQSIENAHTTKDTKSSRADYLMKGVRGRYQFARTQSSPELTDTSNEVTSQVKHNRAPDGRSQAASKPDYSRRKNLDSEVSGTRDTKSSNDDPSSLRHRSFHQSLDTASNSNTPSGYYDKAGLGLVREELASVANSRDVHQEEQDLVNMMASSRLQGLGGHVMSPMNFTHSYIPLQSSSSALASMGYQKSLVGMTPTNFPLVGPPWGSRIQFPQSLVSSPLSHHFPSIDLASNTEEMIESSINDSDLIDSNQEADCGSPRDFDSDTGGSQVLQSDDNGQSTGSSFAHLSTKSIGSSSFLRGKQRVAKENKGLRRAELGNSLPRQNNRREEVYMADRSPSSRIIPTSQASSSRSKASSESSWDASSVKTSKSVRDRKGRKAPSTVYGKGKNGWRDVSVLVDHASSKAGDDNRDWIPLSTMDTEMEERTTGPTPVTSAHSRIHHIPNYEPPQISESESVVPVSPTLVGPDSHQGTMDNSGVVPFAFYLTGPPVPFLAMLPFYNFPAERVNSEGSTSNFDGEEALDNIHVNQLEHNSHSEIFHDSSTTKHDSSLESSEIPDEGQKSDILHSDFKSHWKNLQYGRFCQNPPYHGPLIYPSPVMVPQVYLQGHFPWEGPGRPASTNSNIFSQLMTYGSHILPVQSGSLRPATVHQRYGDEVPRYRGGTGTYLPNTKTSLGYSNARNHRGHYNSDRIDHHSEREGNWNNSSRPQASGRSYSRSQEKKLSSRSDRLPPNENLAESTSESFRNDSFPSHQSQNGPFVSSISSNNASANMAYGMYTLPGVKTNGVATPGPSVPSVVMLYPYDNNIGPGSSAEQVEFGRLGPTHFSAANEVSQYDERSLGRAAYERNRFQGGSPAPPSPDQPSSPQLQRL